MKQSFSLKSEHEGPGIKNWNVRWKKEENTVYDPARND
jgi:hypothetical protein